LRMRGNGCRFPALGRFRILLRLRISIYGNLNPTVAAVEPTLVQTLTVLPNSYMLNTSSSIIVVTIALTGQTVLYNGEMTSVALLPQDDRTKAPDYLYDERLMNQPEVYGRAVPSVFFSIYAAISSSFALCNYLKSNKELPSCSPQFLWWYKNGSSRSLVIKIALSNGLGINRDHGRGIISRPQSAFIYVYKAICSSKSLHRLTCLRVH
jgi:hypothetical protein